VDYRNKTQGRFLSSAACCLLLVACCFIVACASTSDLELLRQDVNRLQRDSLSTKSDLDSLKEKTTGVAKEESFNVMRMNQAEIQSQLSNVAKDIQILSGRFDENKYFLEKTLKDWTSEMDLMKAQAAALARQMREMKDRLAALEGQSKLQGESSKEQEIGKKPAELQKEIPPKEAQAVKPAPDKLTKYETAYNAFKNKRYKESREKFEVFIKEYTKDELADNAYFWIAETFYNEKDFEGAILSYETFLKKYPNSKKAPAGFLKQGLSFIAIGDKKTGTVILEQLIERYPKSKEAELAEKSLEDLNKKTVKKKK
jgi:tol-pal system protein YbgF